MLNYMLDSRISQSMYSQIRSTARTTVSTLACCLLQQMIRILISHTYLFHPCSVVQCTVYFNYFLRGALQVLWTIA